WKWFGDGPIRAASIYDGEQYDARKEAAVLNWTSPIYTDAATNFTTSVTTSSVSSMVGQPTDPIRIIEFRHPVDMWTNRDNGQFYRVYDMGQNIAGWCTLSVTNTNQPS